MSSRIKSSMRLCAIAAAVFLGGGMQLHAAVMKADTVYHGGKIYTITEDFHKPSALETPNTAEVVATLNGQIVFAGSEAEARSQGLFDKGTAARIVDLKGKTIYSTGQGSTPEYALNLVLEKNGLTVGEDVTVVYKTDNSEIAPLLASGEAQVALLPQPFVTSVMGQNETLRVALDMTEEWDKATDGASGLTMGCVVVRTEFAQQNKEALDLFLDEYERSVQTVTSVEGLEHAAQLAEQYNIVKAPVARKAIPACNIVFVQGEQMQQIAGGFLEVLYQANPKSVGGKLPDANFYYNR